MGQSFLSQLLLERDVATDHFMVTRHGKENGCWTLDGSLSGSGDTKNNSTSHSMTTSLCCRVFVTVFSLRNSLTLCARLLDCSQ